MPWIDRWMDPLVLIDPFASGIDWCWRFGWMPLALVVLEINSLLRMDLLLSLFGDQVRSDHDVACRCGDQFYALNRSVCSRLRFLFGDGLVALNPVSWRSRRWRPSLIRSRFRFAIAAIAIAIAIATSLVATAIAGMPWPPLLARVVEYACSYRDFDRDFAC